MSSTIIILSIKKFIAYRYIENLVYDHNALIICNLYQYISVHRRTVSNVLYDHKVMIILIIVNVFLFMEVQKIIFSVLVLYDYNYSLIYSRQLSHDLLVKFLMCHTGVDGWICACIIRLPPYIGV
jgi:hypothetical protein